MIQHITVVFLVVLIGYTLRTLRLRPFSEAKMVGGQGRFEFSIGNERHNSKQ